MRRAQAGALVVAGLMAGVALSGCSSGRAEAQHGKPSATVVTTGVASPHQLVLSGYAAASAALAAAEVHNDANWPALFQTMVNPELAHVQAFITTGVHLGYHARGTYRIIRAEVTSFSPTSAAVKACVYGDVIAYQANGQPAPGNAGRATYSIETAVMVPAGATWVLQDGTAQQFPTAQKAGPLCAG